MANKILKNAGFTPREVLLRRELAALRVEIAALPAGGRRSELLRRRAWLPGEIVAGASCSRRG
jgi:hypothetical protein